MTATKNVLARCQVCCYCGADNEPSHGKDIRTADAYAWRLASACNDAKSCSKRAAARDANMDQRFSLTEAGRDLLEREAA